VIFLLLAFTVLAFLLLSNVDLHSIILRKTQAQNAGDAAALATARWQGATLNLVGELNLLHVLAMTVPDAGAVDAITNMQARLCFTGPLAAFYAAQVAAKNNRIYVDPALTKFYMDHAATVRTQYAAALNPAGELYYPEPWPGAWEEYAQILYAICDDGIAAGPDNARFFSDPGAGHVLFMRGFYDAIIGSNWCWFYLFQLSLLESYRSFHDWPPIPPLEADEYSNSEIFSLGLQPFVSGTRNHGAPPLSPSALAQHIEDAGLDGLPEYNPPIVYSNAVDAVETWYMYKGSDWRAWNEIKPRGGEYPFPAVGEIRPQYDYLGADSVLRVSATVDRIMPEGRRARSRRGGTGASATVNWTAAAKPFGYLDANGTPERPNSAAGLVLPAFRDIRLIPADTASNSNAFSSDIDWVLHIKLHLNDYMQLGTLSPGCPYCAALAKWEQAPFRQSGIDWLNATNSRGVPNYSLCRIPSGGGGGGGGGSKRGH